MKAAVIIVAVLAMCGHMHVSACHVAACAIAAELAVSTVLGFLIIRQALRRPLLRWITAGGDLWAMSGPTRGR